MSGCQVAAWVRIEDCSMEYAVFGDEVEFRIGGQLDGMDIVFSEQGPRTARLAGAGGAPRTPRRGSGVALGWGASRS
ncbi:hypothetical protein GCM10023108_24470 [Saccharopolyspora hordei]|uniref:Uncharacterized protein n=1 Tax=Saccharopolyspora hordei TaxID=1838 RepID=A0A853AQI5_9PSEU|nr:hypothetical protein [Saccharopolyspora hordei]